jgi:hypothetical protein
MAAIGQTKAAPPVSSKPAPSHQVAGSNAPQILPPASRLNAVSPQQVRPEVSSIPVNAATVSSMPMQNAAAPMGAQVPTARSISGTVSVDYRNGLLSVVAERAELGEVLKLVGSKIGTSIEVAPDITADPVVAHISPATPSQVLAQLLDGPQLEYIVMGSDESGHVLNRVVVRKRNGFARQPLVAIRNQASGAAK